MAAARFLNLLDLDVDHIERLLASARQLERAPISDALRGKVLGLIFLNPSLRTLASCQAGMAQLGGSSFVISPGQGSWALESRTGVVMDGDAAEHFREAIPVLEQYANALAIRAFPAGRSLAEDLAEPILGAAAACASKPLISLEFACNHPCQALGDWKTLDDLEVPRRGGKFVLSWAWHPRALPLAVPTAAAGMAALRGMDVVVLAPDGYALPAALLDPVRAAAERSGGSVRETSSQSDALSDAHVVYAKSWGSPQAYGNPAAEAELRAAAGRDWCVRESWFATARAEAVFLHCLPVRRNVVVADEVLDGPRSRVIRQAGNRLHVQKALFMEMLQS